MDCQSAQSARAPSRFEVPENVKAWFATKPGRDTIPPVFVREWLGEVIRSNYRVLFSIAYGFFRDGSRAEDVVQEALLKGLRKVGSLKQIESVVGWLARITRNTCLELMRNNKDRVTSSLEETAQMPASDSANLDRYDQQRLLLFAINELPENQAVVVRLRFLEECDVDAIAERLGIKRNAVEVRLHRALTRLAKQDCVIALKGTLR